MIFIDSPVIQMEMLCILSQSNQEGIDHENMCHDSMSTNIIYLDGLYCIPMLLFITVTVVKRINIKSHSRTL